MYQSGQRRTVTYDSTPLTFNLDFLKDGYDFSQEETVSSYEEETTTSSGMYNEDDSDIDYNYLME